MATTTYIERRQRLTQYFDRTAAATWARLTSDEPLGRIRSTVRAGRNEMRQTLLDWLPQDLSGKTLLDAGCGTGAFAIEAAKRGARVTAIDVSSTLVGIARERTSVELAGRIDYFVGDMLAPPGAPFDYAVAMDSLIHYVRDDKLNAVKTLCAMTRESVLFTFAPRTPALALMHAVGQLAPKRHHRSPEIEPISERVLRSSIAGQEDWAIERSRRVSSGFYISQGMELVKR